MTEKEKRPSLSGPDPGHEILLGLLGAYLIFFLVFWLLLVAGPVRTSGGPAAIRSATPPVSVTATARAGSS